MSIFVARHGETDDNCNGIIQLPSASLSAKGCYQVERLAERMRGENIVRIVSSDYQRARETAAAVSAGTGIDVELEPGLRERNFGDLRGVAYSTLDENPFSDDYVPPGGESWGVFYERVAKAWARIMQLADETDGGLLVITHGFVCEALQKNHLTLPEGEVAVDPENTAVTRIDSRAPWAVQYVNCSRHL